MTFIRNYAIRFTWSRSNLIWRCNFAAITPASGHKFYCNKPIISSVNTSTYPPTLIWLSVCVYRVILIVSLKRSYEKAAKLYAQTEASFEEVALKFMEIKQEDALQAFLLEVSTFAITRAQSLVILVTRSFYKIRKPRD